MRTVPIYYSNDSGKRREIVLTEGLRVGNKTHLPLPQSTYSVESWVDQNRRSSASDLNFGRRFFSFIVEMRFVSPNFTEFLTEFPCHRISQGC